MASEYKETIGRCYYTATGEHADEGAVEKMISSGVGESEMMSKAIQERTEGGKWWSLLLRFKGDTMQRRR